MAQPHFRTHVFVCTNKRATGESCGAKNSEVLRNNLKAKAAQKWGKDVRINAAGCLGQCEHGIAAVIYPQQKWLLNLTEHDCEKIEHSIEEHD